MDLQEIIGLVLFVWLIADSVDNKVKARKRSPPEERLPENTEAMPGQTVKPERKAVKLPAPAAERPPEELAAMRIALMKRRKLDHLLMSDYVFKTRITDRDKRDHAVLREKLNLMLHEMFRYLDLPPVYTVEIIPDEDMSIAPDRAAECVFGERVINFYLRSWYTPDQLTAMLCHECAHYFCLHYNMYVNSDTMLNEHFTDITACLMGFSRYMIIPAEVNYLSCGQLTAVRRVLMQERQERQAS